MANKPNMYGNTPLEKHQLGGGGGGFSHHKAGGAQAKDELDRQFLLEQSSDRSSIVNSGTAAGVPNSGTRSTMLASDSSYSCMADGKEANQLICGDVFATGFKTMEERKPIADRFYLVYLVLLVHGIGVLTPWNMFITAQSYFVDYKFNGPCTEYSKNFLSYLGIASQIPNLLLNLINLFVQFGGSLTIRIVISIIVCIVAFVLTTFLAVIDSSSWPGVFFGITMMSVVLLNCANGVYQNSIYGVAAELPMKYTNAVVLGNNMSGTLTAVIHIISIAVSPNKRIAAIYYFLSAVFVLLVCFDSYFLLPRCKFYRYHKALAHASKHVCRHDDEKRLLATLDEPFTHARCWDRFCNALKPYWKVFLMTYPQLFSVWFTFFVTLTIFPAVQVDVKPLSDQFSSLGKYFTPLTCFVTFNFFAMVGNIFPNFFQLPGPRFLWIPVLVRGLMIPYFVLCNYRPSLRTIPVLIDSDWAYVFMAVLMALTSGYFSSLSMMYAPKVVPGQLASIAGMMAAFFLILGINCGIGFSLVVAWFTENVGTLTPLVGGNMTQLCS